MAEGAMADVVKENGRTGAAVLVLGDHDAFFAERIEGLLHQVQSAQGGGGTVVDRTGIDQVAQAELADAAGVAPTGDRDLGETAWRSWMNQTGSFSSLVAAMGRKLACSCTGATVTKIATNCP